MISFCEIGFTEIGFGSDCGGLTGDQIAVDPTESNFYQEMPDGCFWLLPLQSTFYIDNFYTESFYLNNNTIICP